MSIKIMSEVWEHADVSGSDLLVLLALADFADDSGKAWPSFDTVANKARVSKRHARRILAKLAESGHINVISRLDKSGRNLSNVYYVIPGGHTDPPRGTHRPPWEGDTQTPRSVIYDPSSSTDDDDDGRKAPNSNGHALTDPDPVTVQIRQQLHKAGVIINPMIIERYRDLVVEDGIAVETVLDGIAKATGYGKQHNYNYVYKIVLGLHTGNGQKPQQTTEQPQLDFSIGDIE